MEKDYQANTKKARKRNAIQEEIMSVIECLGWTPEPGPQMADSMMRMRYSATEVDPKSKQTPIESKLAELDQKFAQILEFREAITQAMETHLDRICPVGTIVIFSGNIPEGFLECNGSIHKKSDFPKLSEVLGITYGQANPGEFRLPNLCRKVPMGHDPEKFTLGQSVGHDSFTLGKEHLPPHEHSIEREYWSHHHGVTVGFSTYPFKFRMKEVLQPSNANGTLGPAYFYGDQTLDHRHTAEGQIFMLPPNVHPETCDNNSDRELKAVEVPLIQPSVSMRFMIRSL